MDINFLLAIWNEDVSVSCSSNEKFLGCLEIKAVFGNRKQNEAEQQHHNIGNASKFSQEIKPPKDGSSVLMGLT
jgi:hypothetical protein